MTVCMEYMSIPLRGKSDNAAERGQEICAERTAREKQTRFQKGWFAYDKTEPA